MRLINTAPAKPFSTCREKKDRELVGVDVVKGNTEVERSDQTWEDSSDRS